jgi:hypothetical protein
MRLSTARITGLLYLGMAITGMVAFLLVNQDIYVEGNSVATTANLVENEGLARFGIAMELGVVVFQALAAVWFYKLFRKKDSFVAGLIAVFGMVNAVALMIASAVWLGSLNAALADQSANTQLLYDTHENIWLVGTLFFGLWLIPMGYMVIKSKMPIVLGWILILGGIGYFLSTFTAVLLPEQKFLTDMLPLLATVGEFWIIGYLLFVNKKI